MSEKITTINEVRVFLLEDVQQYLDSAVAFLVLEGFRVVASARSATEAIEYINSPAFKSNDGPNMAILDFNLGTILTGADVAKAIFTICPSFPVISCSASRTAFLNADLPQVKVPETCSMIEISELIMNLMQKNTLLKNPHQLK